jgi:hypothetical protein
MKNGLEKGEKRRTIVFPKGPGFKVIAWKAIFLFRDSVM